MGPRQPLFQKTTPCKVAEGAACMAARRAQARRTVIRMRSSMEPIRARRCSDGHRCEAWFERPESCSKDLGSTRGAAPCRALLNSSNASQRPDGLPQRRRIHRSCYIYRMRTEPMSLGTMQKAVLLFARLYLMAAHPIIMHRFHRHLGYWPIPRCRSDITRKFFPAQDRGSQSECLFTFPISSQRNAARAEDVPLWQTLRCYGWATMLTHSRSLSCNKTWL